jgi:hypothetical protein
MPQDMKTVNTQPITRELCARNDLIFYPKTAEEAAYIQTRLFSLGCFWERGEAASKVQYPDACAAKGLVSRRGELFTSPQLDKPYLLCTADQLGEKYVPPSQAFLFEQFNLLAERLDRRFDAIEKRLDGIEAQLAPANLDKQRLKSPGSGA